MRDPKAIGDRSTLAIIFALQANGFDLLVPFGENTRYDLVIDDGTRLACVQCKTGVRMAAEYEIGCLSATGGLAARPGA
jgi:hypothetical protein